MIARKARNIWWDVRFRLLLCVEPIRVVGVRLQEGEGVADVRMRARSAGTGAWTTWPLPARQVVHGSRHVTLRLKMEIWRKRLCLAIFSSDFQTKIYILAVWALKKDLMLISCPFWDAHLISVGGRSRTGQNLLSCRDISLIFAGNRNLRRLEYES